MPRRVIDVQGAAWTVETSGRTTQYGRDEFGVVFDRVGGSPSERRLARYSPQGAKSRELSFARLSDAYLQSLFHRSQPAWTAPETGYQR